MTCLNVEPGGKGYNMFPGCDARLKEKDQNLPAALTPGGRTAIATGRTAGPYAALSAQVDDELKSWLLGVLQKHQDSLQNLVQQQHLATCRNLEDRISRLSEDIWSWRHDPHGHNPYHDGGGVAHAHAMYHSDTGHAVSSPEHDKPGPPITDEVDTQRIVEDNAATPSTGISKPQSNKSKILAFFKEQPLDKVMCILILLNICSMFVRLQWQGYRSGVMLNLREDHGTWNGAEAVFAIIEEIFTAIFLVELMLRLYLNGLSFLMDITNAFDTAIVLITSTDAYILRPLDIEGVEVGVFRTIRIIRIFRLVTRFQNLRVLMKAIASSFGALGWSMLLMSVLNLSGGIFTAQILTDYCQDDTKPYETRKWVYQHYGSAAKATWTMFEVTFSGGWPSRARPLVEDVHPMYALYFIVYVVCVTFAIVRVTAAMFLKQTMQVANSDQDMVSMEKLKQKEKFAAKLQEFFQQADTSGDGLLSADELEEMLKDKAVVTWLHVLELEEYEVKGLFNILEDGTGEVPFEEFLSGAMELKGHARSIHAISIMHKQDRITKDMQQVGAGLESLYKIVSGGKKDWKFESHSKPIEAGSKSKNLQLF